MSIQERYRLKRLGIIVPAVVGLTTLGFAGLATGCSDEADSVEESVEDAGDAAGDAIDDMGDAVDDAIDDAEDTID